MTFAEMLSAIFRRWIFILVVVVAALAVGAAIVRSEGHKYQAESEVLLTQPALGQLGANGLLTQQKLTLLAVTYANLVSAPGFIQDAERRAGIPTGSETVAGSAEVNSAIVQITVDGRDPGRVVSVARAVDGELQETVAGPVASPGAMAGTVVQNPAAVRVSNRPALVLAVAGIVGLALAVSVAILLNG